MNRSVGLYSLRRLFTSYSKEHFMAGKANAKEFINAKIKEKKVVVFSKSTCPFCDKAKKIIDKYVGADVKRSDVEYIEIERDPNCRYIQQALAELTNASTVPRVFINQECIGGGDETEMAHLSGKLAQMLKQTQ